EQALEELQGQAPPRLAVGFAREVAAHQVRHVVAGRVAVQDLQQEGVDRYHRRQNAVAPGVAEFATGALDHGRLQVQRDIGLDSCEGAEDTGDHPWSPGRLCVTCKTLSSRRPLMRSMPRRPNR